MTNTFFYFVHVRNRMYIVPVGLCFIFNKHEQEITAVNVSAVSCCGYAVLVSPCVFRSGRYQLAIIRPSLWPKPTMFLAG